MKETQATVLRLDLETHKALKIAAIEARISMNQAIGEAVEMWLKATKGGTKR